MAVWLASALGTLALAVAAALLVPNALIFLQVVRAGRPKSPANSVEPSDQRTNSISWPRVAVLIPAHNEEQGIEATLLTLLPQLRPGGRILVVADNCSDSTAAVARRAGVDVVERRHATLRGKGFALDYGIRHLEADPPDVVVIVDADCRLDPGSLDILSLATVQHQRPTQALYLMHPPPDASPKQRLAAFAWLVRNQVRPLGGRAMGWPCQLMGSGMGFVFTQLQTAPVASGNIVEDMQLGMDFAAAGRAPLFVPDARVHSVFPSGDQAGQQQRTRWEHGHLATITGAWRQWGVPGLRGRTEGLLPMLLDLSVPPVALMVMTQVGALVLVLISASLGLVAGPAWAAVAMLALGLLLTSWAVIQAWHRFGRQLLQARELVTMPAYALRKIPLYIGYIFKKQTAWVRTERDAGKP